jgi:hypothetical protein
MRPVYFPALPSEGPQTRQPEGFGVGRRLALASKTTGLDKMFILGRFIIAFAEFVNGFGEGNRQMVQFKPIAISRSCVAFWMCSAILSEHDPAAHCTGKKDGENSQQGSRQIRERRGGDDEQDATEQPAPTPA